MNSLRTANLLQWLQHCFSTMNIILTPLSGDAGFRRYFRFTFNDQSFIAVDSPPKFSNNNAFIKVQEHLLAANVNVPLIIEKDLSEGFFCLSDFGNTLLSDELFSIGKRVVDVSNEKFKKDVTKYYMMAITELEKIMISQQVLVKSLPLYDDEFVAIELAIFKEWLLEKHLNIDLTSQENSALTDCFKVLIGAIFEQPKVFMHRDYHSRNIMILENDELGIIDFQDAVHGPIVYDIVSLLRDCYLRWPDEIIAPLSECYRQRVQAHFPDEDLSKEKWQYWFDLTGLQRHIKASGIFARLHHRDQKSGYLADIPLTLSYIESISAQYEKLSFLHQLISTRVIPALNAL